MAISCDKWTPGHVERPRRLGQYLAIAMPAAAQAGSIVAASWPRCMMYYLVKHRAAGSTARSAAEGGGALRHAAGELASRARWTHRRMHTMSAYCAWHAYIYLPG